MDEDLAAPDFPAEAIAAAAAWWASRLGNCLHDPIGLDAPNRQLTVNDMEWVIQLNLQTQRGKYSPEQVQVYQIELDRVIREHLRGCPGTGECGKVYVGHGEHRINCDYDPDETLSAAAERAGIDLDSSDLPCKTTMILAIKSITVKEGYAAPWVTIWSSRDR